ncbi:hypothetical protein [Paraburkholderia sp. ZP32-5]|uniref:hypothetical protein n=1 Tax=Paraburkholderia sp. ZP32-5 TaxID=2883245 RepID=UPI001F1CDB72|nr:hypothetical protein [Paraburkholderia sp. ZP32-5]
MQFEQWFEGKLWPVMAERVGVMSVDTLNRLWLPVRTEDGYLVAIAKDGKDALVGRMGKRDDGKFCVERVVKARIDNDTICDFEFWYVDVADRQRQAQWLDGVIRSHLGQHGPEGDTPSIRCET